MSSALVLPITVVVHTRNSAKTLEQCLASLPPVAEILVADMASSDSTLTIARRFHARTISVADVGYVEPARAVALAQATQPWILIIDADEALPPGAGEWLAALLEKEEHAVYALPRRNHIFGRALEHTGWWPDYQVRLFRKGAVTWPSEIHAQPECLHKPFKLPATDLYALRHENYQHIAQFIDRMNRYTTIEAQTKKSQHKEDNWLTLMTSEFLSRFAAKQGWRDKEQGLAISLLQSFYPLVAALKRWEANGFASSDGFEQSLNQQLEDATRELTYWRATIKVDQSRGLSRLLWRFRRKVQL